MTDIKDMTHDELIKYAMNVSEKLKTAKIIKENSDYFRTNKENVAIAYKNLSETKKYFEVNNEEFLKTCVESNNNELLTSEQFHKFLSEKI